MRKRVLEVQCEYPTIKLISPVDVIDQNRRRRNETVVTNESKTIRTKMRNRQIHYSFETHKAANASSRDPIDVDRNFQMKYR